MLNKKTALDLTDAERTKIKDTSKLIAGKTVTFAGYDVNTAANSANNIAVENNSLGKLTITAGKAAYRVAKTISKMPASVRTNLKPSEVIAMLRKKWVQGVIDIGDNFVTLVSPPSTMGDREFGGTNEFWNLTPVQRKTHQQEFNSFWRDM